ncbi:MAG: RNA methyltransferase [Saprospiraceae bacterium]|nr:RNA methyltransferase [Saprospiraceae bacterium]
MVSKSEIKEIRSLHLPKYRQQHRLFIAEGEKTCRDLIAQGTFPLRTTYITHEAVEKGLHFPHIAKEKIKTVTATQMEQMTTLRNPTEILCTFEPFETPVIQIPADIKSVLYLDRIQDPGNMGTIIRTADWFGVECVVRSEDSADFFNPKVVISSMGSIGAVRLCTGSVDEVIKKLPNSAVIGTFMDGLPIDDYNFPDASIVILGSEGKGIRPEYATKVQNKITIPGRLERSADSLNVAVAAGILCNHWLSKKL